LRIADLEKLRVVFFNPHSASRNHQWSLVTHRRVLYTANAFTLMRTGAIRGKLLQPKIHQGRLNADGFRFALVASRWNDFLTSRLVEGALDALERLGADEKAVELFRVPGSFEIPLLARKLAASGKWDAVVCLGTIIRGETPHFEYIAGEVTKGIAQAGMETDVPVVYGIVTADTLEQAIDRAGVKAGNKGFEAAMSAVELVNLYKAVTSDK
jgi:6,7-dimethyl-8-ribityllumazine synthase